VPRLPKQAGSAIDCRNCTIKVWNFDAALEGKDQEHSLKTRAGVAAHDKDINSLAISPNDSLVCSGSEVIL
jgi:U3 small nucleolar RNA-associated protein 13